MARLKIYFLLFCIAVSIPLSYVVWRTYAGVAREERAQLQFFADALLDEMQKELTDLIEREESRPVDAYHITLASSGSAQPPSPLATIPKEGYILGYLQNNPDGRMQTPLVADLKRVPTQYQAVVNELEEVNRTFNRKKWSLPALPEPTTPKTVSKKKSAPVQSSFADRYLAPTKRKTAKTHLGQKEVRVEEITSRQMSNIASQEADSADAERERAVAADSIAAEEKAEEKDRYSRSQEQAPVMRQARPATAAPVPRALGAAVDEQRFQVEVAPMQSVFIDPQRVFIFRRVAMNDQIIRQGFVLKLSPFLHHMTRAHFDPHPMADFSKISLMVMDHGRQSEVVWAGDAPQAIELVTEKAFPTPFNFISAAIFADHVPASPARKTLNVALAFLGVILPLGLLAIYQSVRSVVDLSERRSQFVSSVTHELKTPLTNIRMYVEMLEQGIAATPEREQDYLGIIGSESTRLSRLINNVLELSKLEKKQRIVNLQRGRFAEVVDEVRSVMSPKLTREGFELTIRVDEDIQFVYDHEAMLQILINLIENSIKFGRGAAERQILIGIDVQGDWARISVSDTGPGIPRQALKRIFDDFYRADSALTRTTSGTGIGLALVKKLAAAMGGRVNASNNPDAGCTITVLLPLNLPPSAKPST